MCNVSTLLLKFRYTARLLMENSAKILKDLRKTTGCLFIVDSKKDEEDGYLRYVQDNKNLEDLNL